MKHVQLSLPDHDCNFSGHYLPPQNAAFLKLCNCELLHDGVYKSSQMGCARVRKSSQWLHTMGCARVRILTWDFLCNFQNKLFDQISLLECCFSICFH